ncbi:hypothetical protein V2O64_16985 [Verrucomicrobiaceae bacterium 227]
MKNSRASRKPNLGAFHVSCWVMGLVAFVQLMSVGVALAMRGNVREVKTEVKTEYVMIPSSSTDPVQVAPPKPPKPKPVIKEVKVSPVAPDRAAVARIDRERVLNTAPPIIDPVVEALVHESRKARVEGDLYLAHAKLAEAEMSDPENPNVIYGLGANYEAFGVFDKAASFYLKVYKMGPTKAGSLYEKAGLKLAVGLRPDVRDLAMLGWGRMSAPKREANGETRTLVLPVTVAPDRDFDPMLLRPSVRFFEEVDGKVSPAIIKDGDSGSDWVTGVADWQDGEEIAQVWYFVPDQDVTQGFLFGERKFYGFVAELYYDDRLVDIRAEPRTLLQEGRQQQGIEEFENELDGLDLDDFSAGGSLLPKLDDGPDVPEENFGIPPVDPILPGEDEGLSAGDE